MVEFNEDILRWFNFAMSSPDREKQFCYYLKCEYGPSGFFDHEAQVRFHGERSGIGGSICLVNFCDVQPVTKKYGLVKVILYDCNDKMALIGINDTCEHRVSTFSVLKEDLISRFK